MKIGVNDMNDDEIYFDMDENMGSYYDFNLLDLLEDDLGGKRDTAPDDALKLMIKLG